MSFSSAQKSELINCVYKSACCRRALLSGILFARARVFEEETVVFNLEKRESAEFAAKLIKEFYGKNAKISKPPKGGRCVVISFESKSAAKYVSDISKSDVLFAQKCAVCLSSFLRGVFIASGRISDPMKQYDLEITLGERAEILSAFLSDLGVPPLVAHKPHGDVIYYKNSSLIEDFCALAAMNTTAFAIMNAKIKSDIRNNANRIANCETNNIGKAVNASMKQINTLIALERAGLFSSLPEELEATARLRMEHRDLSLSQLAAISVPPISKSGLSHRLAKIIELAEQLLHK